jgi:hypothetical protein
MDLDATITVTGKALTVAATVPVLFLGGGLRAVLLMQAVGGASALLVVVLVARKVRLRAGGCCKIWPRTGDRSRFSP